MLGVNFHTRTWTKIEEEDKSCMEFVEQTKKKQRHGEAEQEDKTVSLGTHSLLLVSLRIFHLLLPFLFLAL